MFWPQIIIIAGENLGRQWICVWSWWWQWFHRCILIPKFTNLYMLNVYSFLYVSHTQIKWFKNNKTSPLGTLTPPWKEADPADGKMSTHMQRTKVPLPWTSTNCEHESEAIWDQPALWLSAALWVSEPRRNQLRVNYPANLENHGEHGIPVWSHKVLG